jgi:polyisoprenoid-binding protein YceI
VTTTQASIETRPAAGTYALDPSHSVVSFAARHLMVSKVRGRFEVIAGTVTIADDTALSAVDATIDTASVHSGDAKRDEHLRSDDFFDVSHYPTITFRSTAVNDHGDGTFDLTGDLTIRDTTRPVVLEGEYLGTAQTPWASTVIGFTAETEVSRKQWGLDWNAVLETGGVVVGDKIKLSIDVEAVKQ